MLNQGEKWGKKVSKGRVGEGERAEDILIPSYTWRFEGGQRRGRGESMDGKVKKWLRWLQRRGGAHMLIEVVVEGGLERRERQKGC